MLSTQLIKLNYPDVLSHWHNTTVSLETSLKKEDDEPWLEDVPLLKSNQFYFIYQMCFLVLSTELIT